MVETFAETWDCARPARKMRMNKITFPLEIGRQGAAVGDLQEALFLLLERRVIMPDDEAMRRQLFADLLHERDAQTYGDITAKVVDIVQRQRQLERSGRVDEPTANAINAWLQELGLLDLSTQERALAVSGHVRRDDGLPFTGALVRAFHESEQGAIRLG